MPLAKQFFSPLGRAFLFLFFTIGGSHIIYKEVVYPGFQLLPYEIYNPILDLDFGRFIFRTIFFLWTLFVYFFLEFILIKYKWKDLLIVKEKKKISNFFKGCLLGACLILVVIAIVGFSNILEFIGVDFSFETFSYSVSLYLIAILMTAFSLELIFRAIILEQLAKYLNAHVAILITSVMFGSIFVYNGNDYYPVTEFVLSLFLGYVYLRFGFYYVFGIHFAWDFIESIVYSNTIFHIAMEKGDLASALKEERLISIFVLLAPLIWFFLNHIKNKKRKRKLKATS